MNVERNADNHGGVCIGQIRANGDVYNNTGVHIGHADADGSIRTHTGVHLGTARPTT